MARMKNDVCIYPVQTIGQENIVAGKLVTAPTVTLFAFVHGKIALPSPTSPTANLEVTVRSQSVDFSRALAKAAVGLLK